MQDEQGVQVVRLYRCDGDTKLKAFVDVAIGGYIIKGVRVIHGKNGLFLGMPQEKAKDGKWYSSFYPATKEAKKALDEVILDAFSSK
jgi:DNA-binding cell septation regulator SpoVG